MAAALRRGHQRGVAALSASRRRVGGRTNASAPSSARSTPAAQASRRQVKARRFIIFFFLHLLSSSSSFLFFFLPTCSIEARAAADELRSAGVSVRAAPPDCARAPSEQNQRSVRAAPITRRADTHAARRALTAVVDEPLEALARRPIEFRRRAWQSSPEATREPSAAGDTHLPTRQALRPRRASSHAPSENTNARTVVSARAASRQRARAH